MWNRKRSVSLSIAICFIIAAVITLLIFTGPQFVQLWFSKYRGWAEISVIKHIITVFCACFYPSAILGYFTLYSLLKLLFNIKKDEIFTLKNVKYLRIISWCCFAVAIITLVGGVFYIPFLFITVASGFIGLMLRIIKNVMQSAVSLREENDLTI